MSMKKELTREEAIRLLNQEFETHLQEFDDTSKEEVASSIVLRHHLKMDESWVAQLERRLDRRFSAIEKFKIEVFHRIYFFHGDGAGRYSVGEMFNE